MSHRRWNDKYTEGSRNNYPYNNFRNDPKYQYPAAYPVHMRLGPSHGYYSNQNIYDRSDRNYTNQMSDWHRAPRNVDSSREYSGQGSNHRRNSDSNYNKKETSRKSDNMSQSDKSRKDLDKTEKREVVDKKAEKPVDNPKKDLDKTDPQEVVDKKIDKSKKELEITNKRELVDKKVENQSNKPTPIKILITNDVLPVDQTPTDEVPAKRRRVSIEELNPVAESVTNPHLKMLDACNAEVSQLKSQLKKDKEEYRLMNEAMRKKMDSIRETQIKIKSLKKKREKICKNIAAHEHQQSDNESNHDDDIMEIEPVKKVDPLPQKPEIIDVESQSSDSSDSDDSSSDSSSSSVQILSLNKAENVRDSVKSIISKSSDPSVTLVTGTNEPVVPVEIRSSKTSSHSTTSVSNTSKKSELKVSAENQFKPEGSEKSFVLEVEKDSFNSLFIKPLKADIENGLFNAIEPKLDTIKISDIDPTFVTDIKIFNNRLFVSASHGLVRQYFLDTHELVQQYPGHSLLVHCLLPTVHPYGVKRLLSGGFDKKLLVHNIDTAEILLTVEYERPILSICDILDYVFIGDCGGFVSTFSLEKNRKMCTIPVSETGISCICATKEGSRYLLFVGSNDGQYSMWDALLCTKISVITPVSHMEIPIGFIMLQKHRILAYTKNHVHFIHYSSSKNSISLNHFGLIRSACITKNYVIIGGENGQLSVYKLKGSHIQKNPIQIIKNSPSSIISLTFYNNTIISGDKCGKIYHNRLIES